MFNPSREEVREMYFAAWRKYRAGQRARQKKKRAIVYGSRDRAQRKSILAAILAKK